MSLLKKGLLILLLPLCAFTAAHKFYVSVTNIVYSEKDASLQITSRIFIEDFEKIILERYGVIGNLATETESKLADQYIEKYLRTKFSLSIDGEKREFEFIGKKYDNDVIICYLEILEVDLPKIATIEVDNKILTDIFDEQQNVVHFKIKGKKKSFVLLKPDTKGMLKL